jgi:putative ABC transport system permease protein
MRMALGASAGKILGMILDQGLGPLIGDAMVGVASSFALMSLMPTLLFGVESDDPLVFGTISAFLLLVGTLACYLPALWM